MFKERQTPNFAQRHKHNNGHNEHYTYARNANCVTLTPIYACECKMLALQMKVRQKDVIVIRVTLCNQACITLKFIIRTSQCTRYANGLWRKVNIKVLCVTIF